MIDSRKIRNFCIIAHIDHGKSTLADRLIETTGTVIKREMREQVLDQMDLERERGITIKLAPVRMVYEAGGQEYILNLIDTPGHVDFTYEVSRSLAAVEGAILLVDATQGIQAQTLSNLHLAREQGLTIIPVVNKVDVSSSEPEKTAQELQKLLSCNREEIIFASGKTGAGVSEILERIIGDINPPKANGQESLRALIFDSIYDSYKGVVAYVRIFDGKLERGDEIKFMATGRTSEVVEVGTFSPKFVSGSSLWSGEIGYIATGLKETRDAKVGDTITLTKNQAEKPLAGYRKIKPFVFASIYETSGQPKELREALEKLQISDSSLSFEPESSKALGMGFRCGFLGLLHMEITQERLEREYNLDLIVTTPSVSYKITETNGEEILANTPDLFPDPSKISEVHEPWVRAEIILPAEFLGQCMDLAESKRGVYKEMVYLDEAGKRVMLVYEVPLAEIIVDFYDLLKSVSSGYASLNYEFLAYRAGNLVKLDILVAGEKVEALSVVVPREQSQKRGNQIVKKLKEVIGRQLFEISLQAAISGKIIARENISAARKDVTGYLYGGDVTRKRKLLEKQKKGKKRMKRMGKVDIPQEAFLGILKK